MPSQEIFNAKSDGAVYTTSNGAPVNEPYAAQRVGLLGPLLLQGTFHTYPLQPLLTPPIS